MRTGQTSQHPDAQGKCQFQFFRSALTIGASWKPGIDPDILWAHAHYESRTKMNNPTLPPRAAALTGDFHRDCFACGIGNPRGLGLEFSVETDGTVAACWQPSGEYQSYAGRLHGGIIATLLDGAMVHALRHRGVHGVTAEMHIRYHHPVMLDEPVLIRGRVASRRHGLHFCEAELLQRSSPAVRAMAKFMVLDSA
jgi:uncharacterized protein (TIGR00369 family)